MNHPVPPQDLGPHGARTTVGIVDDQPLLVAAFTALVDAQPDLRVVGTGADGLQAIELVEQHHPDVLLMDIRMPHLDGVEATRAITARPGDGHGATRVLVLTTFNVDKLVLGAVAAGARGFLLKDAEPLEVIHAIRAVSRGEAVISTQAAPALLDAFRPAPAASFGPPARPELTAVLSSREREVLTLIGRGLTNGEISEELFIATTTVKTHVGNVMAKLNARDRVALVILAHSVGLVGTPGTVQLGD